MHKLTSKYINSCKVANRFLSYQFSSYTRLESLRLTANVLHLALQLRDYSVFFVFSYNIVYGKHTKSINGLHGIIFPAFINIDLTICLQNDKVFVALSFTLSIICMLIYCSDALLSYIRMATTAWPTHLSVLTQQDICNAMFYVLPHLVIPSHSPSIHRLLLPSTSITHTLLVLFY